MAEGLAYCLKFTDLLPEPEDKSNANLIRQVVDFCLDGLRGEDGNRLTVNPGGEVTGAVNWLISADVNAVNFYTTETPVPMLFVSLPSKSGDDWRLMDGFMSFVQEGPQTADLGQLILAPHPEIDMVFNLRFAELQKKSSSVRETLKKALGGRSNLDETLRSLSDPQNNRLNSFF